MEKENMTNLAPDMENKAAEAEATAVAAAAEAEAVKPGETNEPEYSLSDDRRVKALSPGMLVAKRFFRNRLAVTGMVVLVIMFIFSYIGGIITPYEQDQKFYRIDKQDKDYAGVQHNEEYRYTIADKDAFKSIIQSQTLKAILENKTEFTYKDQSYKLDKLAEDVYTVSTGGRIIGIASKQLVNSSTKDPCSFELTYNAFMALADNKKEFTAEGTKYNLGDDGVITDASGNEIAYISSYIVKAIMSDVFFSRDFKTKLIDAIEAGSESFSYTGEDGVTADYILKYDASKKIWNVQQETETRVFDTYSGPSKEHWLGTDKNGMDMLTRLMYGGRISLMIGFIVVFIEALLGVILGGIAGYFGGWIDGLIMRIVDIFYCIPSMPIIIIIGAAMDAANVPSLTRMIYLMLILGFLGWAGVARLVRGQILSLREQEFMTATEACGIAVSRRIFRHLLPNVIPQLIVYMTMGLGSTIIMEATLSFLGLGVRFPFASWGNIINDVNDTFVLTNYWFIWIPAGVLLLITVLAFNIVGDGLRDAFDPKMKR